MKKFLVITMCVVLLFAQQIPVFSLGHTGHWAEKDITYLIEQTVLAGDYVAKLDIDTSITRADFVVLMNKTYNYTEQDTADFNDVTKTNPYYEQFKIAKKAGYLQGDEFGNANPKNLITRAEVATIVSRVEKLEPTVDVVFDETDVPKWAFGYVGTIMNSKIMIGNDDGKFNGFGNMTYAEAYTIASRILSKIEVDVPSVYMVGDSIMEQYDYARKPQCGWGETLPEFLNGTRVYNHAIGGRSTKSFIDEGRWDIVLKYLKEGDYVIISFGHNDQKSDEKLHTDPETTYKEYLAKYVNDAKSKGATPIIATSVPRNSFANGVIKNSLTKYVNAAKEAAESLGVTCIDLCAVMTDLFNTVGSVEADQYFLTLDEGVSDNFPDGKIDSTHFQIFGARMISKAFCQEIVKTDNSFANLVNKDKITGTLLRDGFVPEQ